MTYHFNGIDHVQLAAPEGCEKEARDFLIKFLDGQKFLSRNSYRNAVVCGFNAASIRFISVCNMISYLLPKPIRPFMSKTWSSCVNTCTSTVSKY